MLRLPLCLRAHLRRSSRVYAAVLLTASLSWAQQSSVDSQQADWQQQVQQQVQLHQLDAALATVNQRLADFPADMEAHGWRGRLLSWRGQWASAEAEYRLVLDDVPNDTDILCGLADVLLWQSKTKEALSVIDRARAIEPSQPEILLRRARILQALGESSEARSQYREILQLNPDNRDAKHGMADLSGEGKYEFSIGGDGSTFNNIGPAEDEILSLAAHWTPQVSTVFITGFYQRFGEAAADLEVSSSYRITKNNALTIGGGFANQQDIIPKNDTFFEYGRGVRLPFRFVKGLEASYQQHWFWYQGAHVLTFSGMQLYYLPRDWTWSITLTAARTGFSGTGVEWEPSGITRLEFPAHRNLTGNLFFANGTEDFAQIDQIGRFSARTYGGGVKYRLRPGQDIRGYLARQYRSDSQTQTAFGVNYGFHF
jgi:tetratricopeptide (TPR) repeat protein